MAWKYAAALLATIPALADASALKDYDKFKIALSCLEGAALYANYGYATAKEGRPSSYAMSFLDKQLKSAAMQTATNMDGDDFRAMSFVAGAMMMYGFNAQKASIERVTALSNAPEACYLRLIKEQSV